MLTHWFDSTETIPMFYLNLEKILKYCSFFKLQRLFVLHSNGKIMFELWGTSPFKMSHILKHTCN